MNEFLIYGIGALLTCFALATFFLSRIDADIIPENYEFQLDPFWHIWGVMLVGGVLTFSLFPRLPDMVNTYSYFDVTVPFLFAGIIYLSYILDITWLTNILILGAGLTMSYAVPDAFQLFPDQLSPWQDKVAVALLIFVITKGLALLNGLGVIASMQFIMVMFLTALLAYFGILPQILGVLALAYGGTMLAFAFFSWPPEKLVLSNGAFASLGFILSCFMLNGATEFAEAPMFIAASYLFTETGIVLYRRFISRVSDENGYKQTSYFRISEDGKYETEVVRGILKILFIDIVLALIQTASTERLAFPVFSIALNLWFLSILSGDTNPEELLSISRWGKNVVKEALTKKKNNKKSRKK